LDAVAPYIDYLVVADNGSTDRTLEIVQEFMDRTGISGEIVRDEWYGFDKNKTEWEIMQEKSFDRIWDCGSMKFEMSFENI
jgi:glycosyltransferase involved in cell wall biosynthesis